MVLGTYHFAAPGLDAVVYDVADVLTADRQAELEAIVAEVARFRPTKVAIEALAEEGARFDSLFASYALGRHQLQRDEREQIGFRLAKSMGHSRVHAVDYEGSFPFGPVLEYAERRDTAFVTWFGSMLSETAATEDSLQRTASIAEILRHDNAPDRLARDHGNYVRVARVGAGDGYVGVPFVSAWYERNIGILANILAISGPGDRVVVLFGEGHAGILRELLEAAPGIEVVDVLGFLPDADRPL